MPGRRCAHCGKQSSQGRIVAPIAIKASCVDSQLAVMKGGHSENRLEKAANVFAQIRKTMGQRLKVVILAIRKSPRMNARQVNVDADARQAYFSINIDALTKQKCILNVFLELILFLVREAPTEAPLLHRTSQEHLQKHKRRDVKNHITNCRQIIESTTKLKPKGDDDRPPPPPSPGRPSIALPRAPK